MIDIEKLSKKLNLNFMQTVQLKQNYSDVELIKTTKINDEQMLLLILADIKLDDHQLNILNKSIPNFNNLLTICSNYEMKDIKNNVSLENENALFVLCCKLLINLNKNQKINLKNVKEFIVETFEVLNKYSVYDALVTKYIIIQESL